MSQKILYQKLKVLNCCTYFSVLYSSKFWIFNIPKNMRNAKGEVLGILNIFSEVPGALKELFINFLRNCLNF